jgi:hypothetical protein
MVADFLFTIITNEDLKAQNKWGDQATEEFTRTGGLLSSLCRGGKDGSCTFI